MPSVITTSAKLNMPVWIGPTRRNMKSLTSPCRVMRSSKLLVPPDQIPARPTNESQVSRRLSARYASKPSNPAPTATVSSISRHGSGSEAPQLRKEPGFSASRNSPSPIGNSPDPISPSSLRAMCFEV